MILGSLPIPDDANVECLGINVGQLRQLMHLVKEIQRAHMKFNEVVNWKYSYEIGEALKKSSNGSLQDLVKKGVDEIIAKGKWKK